jgi:NADPH:quinone reductase-like Zn-dependent oxidoreductase
LALERSASAPPSVAVLALMARRQRLQGLTVGSREHQIDMVRAIDVTGLKPVIDQTFALEKIAAAFRHEEAGAHFGKICLQI